MSKYSIGDYVEIMTRNRVLYYIKVLDNNYLVHSRKANSGILLHSTNKHLILFKNYVFFDKHGDDIIINKIEDSYIKNELELRYKLYLLNKS